MINFQKALKRNNKYLLVLALILPFFISSCNKTGEEVSSDETVVNINLIGSESNIEEDVNGKLAKLGSISNNAIQTTVIPFDDNFSLVATLSPEGSGMETVSVQTGSVSSSSVPRAVTGPVRANLAPNVKYKVLVYNQAGVKLQEKEYSYGNEKTVGGFILDGQTTYTFVAYSINSISTLPIVSNSNLLSTASVNNVSADLMYFKEVITLKKGSNNLNVVLKHKFSQITTTVSLDEISTGLISAISAPFIKPSFTSGSINLNTGAITYNTSINNGVPVLFSTLNARSITSAPTQIITPATTTGALNIGSVTMNGLTKGNISIPGLRINPGCKYNLNLAFVAPCTETVNAGDFAFNVTNGVTKEFAAPAADFGFVFDIFTLDNSFNLRVNNTNLVNQEIQFEGTQGTAGGQNLKFADGSYWGDGTVPQVYNMTGSTGKPVIRIYIDATGKVSLFGSKVANGPLFPLVLSGSAVFNTIVWNKSTANSVVASQIVKGPTYMSGEGYGKKIIACR